MNTFGNVLYEIILCKKSIRSLFLFFIITPLFFFITTSSVFAAIGAGGATCRAQSKTAGTSLACTVGSENIEVGNTAVLFFGGDNTATVDGNDGLLSSVTDSGGNTWIVQRCYTNAQGSANAGATTCIATAYITSQLTSGVSTITANFTSITAKAILVNEFTTTSGYYLSATGTPQDLANDGADPGAMTISSLPSSQYLFTRSSALERDVTTWTPTSGFTTSGCNTTTGAGAASNNGVCGEFIIASATTTATSNPTGTAVDNGSTFIAFSETAIPTTLSNGTNPSSITIAPGATATSVNAFAFQTSSSTDIITSITLNISNASSTSLVEITNDAGSIVYGSTTNPTGTTTTISLTTNITATTATTTYKIRITPKSHANLPSPSVGMLYPVTATVSTWTGTNIKTGGDTTSSTVTIDNYTTPSFGIDSTTFATKVDYTTGANPRSVTSADFNNDGKLDMAVANQYSNSVSVFLNTSTTTTSFADKVDYTTGDQPLSVTSADFNNDGKLDMAVVSVNSTSVSVFLNTSTTTTSFTEKVDYTTGSNPFFVTAADFNNDGKIDMAVANQTSASVSVFLNNGDGIFATKVDYTTGVSPLSVTSADFNNDGKLDMAVANQSPDSVSVFLNTSTTTTSFADKVDYTTGDQPYSVTSADFNNDGKLDMAVTNVNSNSVSVFLNTSTTTMSFAEKVDYTTGSQPYSVTSADFNNDGKLDMAVANSDSISASLFLNTSTTTTSFADKVDYTTGVSPFFVTAADFNNDGKIDMAVANYSSSSVSVILNSSIFNIIATPSNTQVTISYTTPNYSDLNSIVILSATSTITDVPVEGTTYTGGETIGGTTVACVDTSVSTSTADSCTATGLTNGLPYHFKVFAKDSHGNYSTGLVPTGSPATPALSIATTTLSNVTEVGNTTIAPGGSATFVNAFTLQTSTTTSIDTLTDVTLSISNASSTSLVEVTNSAGTVVYGSSTNPTGTTTTITLNQNNLTVVSSPTTYKIRITPKSQANLPSLSLGMLYPVNATVSTWTGTNSKTGSDATSSIVTIDNDMPSTTGGTGINWSTTTLSSGFWYGVTYGNGLFVAVSGFPVGDQVMTSSDGITWNGRTSATTNSWQSVTYGNGLFVAVSSDGSGNRVMTSPDGITWTSRTSAANNVWSSVTYGNGVFVAVAQTGTGDRVMTSPDGITWTSRTNPIDNDWASVTYGNNLFVSVAINGTTTSVMTSPDGITWTIRTAASNNHQWSDIVYGGNKFVAVAAGGSSEFTMTSTDGINWSLGSQNDFALNKIVYGNGKFIATRSSASDFRISYDGLNWSTQVSATSSWKAATYGNGVFVSTNLSDFALLSTSTLPTVTAGDGSASTTYTTPGDADLNSIVILRATSTITDVPVEGTIYTGGETIGSATVACVDTSVSTSTSDSCLSTGLTNGVSYHFKVFAKDSYGNYSTGLVPAGSPATPTATYITLSNGTNPSNVIVSPGATATSVNAFAFQTTAGTDTITAITLNISNASSTSLVEITNDAGSIVYGSTTNPTGTTTTISLTTNIVGSTTLTQYKVRITPKSQTNLPSRVLGMLYPVTATVSTWTGVNNNKLGSDTSSSVVTIDNLPPATSGNSGITWSTSTSIVDNSWQSVAYGNGIFVAIAQSGTGDRVMTSTNGVTWTSRTSSDDNSWKSVTFANGLFVAISYTGSGNRVMTSPDGITWTSRTSAVNNNWKSITYGNGLFVAVSDTGSGDRVMISFDGINWSTSTSAVDSNWQSVTYGNGIFVAVADSGANQLMTSTDGISWTARNTPNTNLWYSVTYGNNLFVAVSQDGVNNRAMTSPDGINWTLRTSAGDYTWTSVTYGNGMFVAVASNGGGQQVMTSYDGYSWTLRTSSADNLWNSVTYGDGVFVAVSNSGSSNRVMISTSSAVTVTAGDTIATTTYTTPGDSDLHSIVILSSTSTITDFPVEGTTYTGGEIIGSSTVVCVDTSVATTTPDSCVSTGLTNGTTYYFKVFARDNYGNYSAGIVPDGSPATPNPTTPTITLGDGSNPSNSTIAPSGATTTVDAFTFSSNTGSPTVTAVTIEYANASSTNRIQIINNDGSVVYGSSTYPTGTSTIITLNTPITTTSSSTQYKIQIVPKSHSELPEPNLGLLYPVTATIINFTTTALTAGADVSSATITIDNVSPLTSATTSTPSVTAGNTQITTNYTTPTDTDLHSMVVLRSSSAVVDVPVEGATYTGGETIGGATVACVDTSVSPSTIDSCISTGLTNGVSYHFKLFAKDTYGNYSTGTVPTNSPIAPIPGIITVTLGDGVESGNATIAPGSSAVNNNSFTLQTDYSTSSVSSVTVTLANASSTSLIEITNNAGSVVYGSTTNPTGASTTISLSPVINVDTSSTQYKIRITPKTQANLPAPSIGIEYTVTSIISAWVVSTGTKSGADATSSTLTIDNLSPSNTSTSTANAGNTQVSITYTNPNNSDLNSIVVLRSTSAITDTPVEGSTYTVGNTIGSATVACVDTTVTPGASDLCFATGLVNDTPYHFRVFAKDTYGNYSTGLVPGGSPVTPSVGAVASRVDSYRIRRDNGNETSATYYAPENSEINSAFFNGDAARIRFVISNQGVGISNMSYRLEYSSSSCTTWVTVPKVTDAIVSDPVRTSTSYYVSDGGLTTHSSGVSVPSGKSFVPGYIQTFDNITQPIVVNTNEYTEVEFMIRTTSAMIPGTPYCFRVTDSGDSSSLTYSQTPSIISRQTQFRPQAGGGGGGYLLIIEADSLTGTTTVTGGGANGNGTSTNEATTTPNGGQSTTTPSQGGDGGGDLGFLNFKNNFAFNYSLANVGQGMVLGATTEGMCVNFKNYLFVGKTDAITNGEVSELQYYLKQQGYFNVKETGYFGLVTELALKKYQKDNGIIDTGVVGKITKDKMKKNSCYNQGLDLSMR